MMSFVIYEQLGEASQYQLLSTDGVFLLERTTEQLTVQLYALYYFHVELYSDRKDGSVFFIRPFEGTKRFDAYLELISIDELLDRAKE